MNLVNYWNGAFGRYEIPPAIIWLSNKANAIRCLPPVGHGVWAAFGSLEDRDANPGYTVIAEWGAWRDGEEEKRLVAEVAQAAKKVTVVI